MSTARKGRNRPPAAATRLARFVALLLGPGRPAVLVGVLAAALLGGWYLVWRQVRPYVLSSPDYLLTAKDVQTTPLPEWIHTDVRAEVFRNATLDGPLSILDDDLTERIANAFSLHPWIAEVGGVTKRHPARVEVKLVYRRPVCMVEVPGGLLPVDVQGVLLPTGDFSAIEASRYPRLAGVETGPMGAVGEYWGDGRVIGGAEIAAALAEVWDGLNLSRIVPSDGLPVEAAGEPTYTILTQGGTRIFWGRAPNSQAPGELPVAEKVARLQQYFAEQGTLEGRGAPQRLDVQGLRVSARPEP